MGCSYWNLFLMIQWQSWLRTQSIIMNWCDSVQCCDGVRTRLWWLLWWVAGRGRCESSYDHNQCNMGTLWFILKPITLMFLTDEETSFYRKYYLPFTFSSSFLFLTNVQDMDMTIDTRRELKDVAFVTDCYPNCPICKISVQKHFPSWMKPAVNVLKVILRNYIDIRVREEGNGNECSLLIVDKMNCQYKWSCFVQQITKRHIFVPPSDHY